MIAPLGELRARDVLIHCRGPIYCTGLALHPPEPERDEHMLDLFCHCWCFTCTERCVDARRALGTNEADLRLFDDYRTWRKR